jgi:HSP20 family molecular chaperone IbpA
MKNEDPLTWMWLDACEMVRQAERLHRRLFGVGHRDAPFPCWEPPVDIYETARELHVIALLPGVDQDKLAVTIDGGILTITGSSPFPVPVKAHIHRLEIPYGDFEKTIALPSPAYQLTGTDYRNGCLTLSLHKPAENEP